MKKVSHTIPVALIVFLILGSLAVVGVAAKEPGSITEVRLTTDDAGENAQYGRSVATEGDLVAVGMGGDGSNGSVYLYKRQGTFYIPEAKLDFPEALPADCNGNAPEICPEFGRTVAIQGDTVFVGARFAPVGSLKAGAVYVFRKYKDSWEFEHKIVSPAPESGDNFGRALAIQGDLLVVTARKTVNEEGAAYVFVFSDGQWIPKITLIAGDPLKNAYFGQSIDIQGDLIAIGARNANPNKAGAVYLFRNVSDVWTQVAKVTPYDGKNGDQYGFSVALSGDTMAVGSRRADPDGLEDAGAVYVYTMYEDSAELVTRLAPCETLDEFGQSVAFPGNTLAVGAWKDDIDSNADQGSLYLFSRKGGQWIETGKISASDGAAGDEFGYSLAAYGNRVVTGAHFADFISEDGGAAYVLTVKPLH